MNLLEKDYFGLIYEDKTDPRNWLDLDRRIGKLIKSQFQYEMYKIINDLINCSNYV